MNKIKILFVCMGNICRSPTAHGVFRNLVKSNNLEQFIEIDSAGTHAYHVHEPPDSRSRAVARQRGINIDDLRARIVCVEDFTYYDYILAMDASNHKDLKKICPPNLQHKIRLFLDYAPELEQREVPDPYYGGPRGFDLVLDIVESASHGFLEYLQDEHKLAIS